ncbi:hypothetical protein ACWDFL_38445 [Streptomyces bungoensis]
MRVTGALAQPDDPEAFTVDGLEVLEPVPASVRYDLVLERFGNYVLVFDVEGDLVPVFTASGRWVGEAANANAIGDRVDAYEEGDLR